MKAVAFPRLTTRRQISEWTAYETAIRKDRIQREIIASLETGEEPQSVSKLVYGVHMNVVDRDYELDEQHVFVLEVLNDLIRGGRVTVAFMKLEHLGGITSLAPSPYIRLVR